VEVVLKCERPTKLMKIHSFFGLEGYKRFIEGFSMIATSLTQLTRKKVRVVKKSVNKAFRISKESLLLP